MKKALSDRLSHKTIRRQKTLEALADVDAGRVTDHERIRAWARNLDNKKAPARGL